MSSDEYVDMLVRIDHQELLHTYIDDRIRNNMDDVRKFIHPLIAYTNGQEILRIYMRNNALQFTMDDLEFACSKLNASVVQEIVNSNILPNEKCIESVFQYVNAHNAYQYPKSVCHIIAIFIHCGCTIPEHILRRVLR